MIGEINRLVPTLVASATNAELGAVLFETVVVTQFDPAWDGVDVHPVGKEVARWVPSKFCWKTTEHWHAGNGSVIDYNLKVISRAHVLRVHRPWSNT